MLGTLMGGLGRGDGRLCPAFDGESEHAPAEYKADYGDYEVKDHHDIIWNAS